jgi:hypothetical protein
MVRGLISIWFFIGLLLLIYGVIILVSAFIVEPAPHPMSYLHVEYWWGALLTAIGAIYSYVFRPR